MHIYFFCCFFFQENNFSFWSTLLSNALPLLNNDELLLSSNDTFTILQCLEEKVDCLKAEDMLKDLRLAVANNLGRCLIHEAQLQ